MTPNQYITDNYTNIKSWLYNVTRGEKPHLYEDMVHEVIAIFLQHKKAQQAIDTGTARYFLVRIALNQWRSSTSPFHYQYRDSFLDYTEKESVDEEYNTDMDAMEKLAMLGLDDMYQGDEDERYQAIIIMLYHSMGSNYSAVGRHLGMQHTTIRKLYLRGLKNLKDKVTEQIKKLQNGTNNNIDDFTDIIDKWDILGSGSEQQAISVASQIFKTGYFNPS
jgi:DNA-directed RNA polymerase specialized sigma24 family protein